jgi:small subunit ribosomal protein S16
MALAIRLARGGAKKRPYYRIVVPTAATPRRPLHREGRHLQSAAGEGLARARQARRRAHLALAERRRPAVRPRPRFLDAAGIKERAARNNPNKGKPGEKAKERAEERATKAAEAAEAAAAAAAAAEPAPAEEPAAEEAPAAEAPAADDPPRR